MIQCEGLLVTSFVVALSEVEAPVVERERVVVAIVDASNTHTTVFAFQQHTTIKPIFIGIQLSNSSS